MPTFSAPLYSGFEMRLDEPAESVVRSLNGSALSSGNDGVTAWRYPAGQNWAIEVDGYFSAFNAEGWPVAGQIVNVRLYVLTAPGQSAGRHLAYQVTGAAYDAYDFLTAAGLHSRALFDFMTAGDDVLVASSGQDGLAGGDGNDTYQVNSPLDQIREVAGQGYDTVEADGSFWLPDHIERLNLVGYGDHYGWGNVRDNDISGNSNNNHLAGFAGDDSLYGGEGDDLLDGGRGADFMFGSQGDDDYRVDDAGDVVEEGASLGYDRILTRVDYALPDHVEEMKFISVTGGRLTGNGDGNLLTGHVGDDRLQGMGGNDDLRGSLGGDLLIGGLGDDRLTGGDGDDILFGGAGADVMLGGAGADRFVFDLTSGREAVRDFQDGDTLQFDSALFATVQDVMDAIRITAGGALIVGPNGFRLLVSGVNVEASDIVIAPPDPDWLN